MVIDFTTREPIGVADLRATIEISQGDKAARAAGLLCFEVTGTVSLIGDIAKFLDSYNVEQTQAAKAAAKDAKVIELATGRPVGVASPVLAEFGLVGGANPLLADFFRYADRVLGSGLIPAALAPDVIEICNRHNAAAERQVA